METKTIVIALRIEEKKYQFQTHSLFLSTHFLLPHDYEQKSLIPVFYLVIFIIPLPSFHSIYILVCQNVFQCLKRAGGIVHNCIVLTVFEDMLSFPQYTSYLLVATVTDS
jgi:hypothetical protein